MSKEVFKFSLIEMLIIKHAMQSQLRQKKVLLEKAKLDSNEVDIQALTHDIGFEEKFFSIFSQRIEEFRRTNGIKRKSISRQEEIKQYVNDLDVNLAQINSLQRS